MTIRRTRPLKLGEFFDEYIGEGIITLIIMYLVVFFIGAGVFASVKEAHNHTARDHERLEKIFYSYGPQAKDHSPETEKKRQDLANQLINVENTFNKAGTSVGYFSGIRWAAITQTAKTGQPVILTNHRWSFRPYWHFLYGGWSILVQWIVAGMILIIAYSVASEDRNRYKADLPWNRVWPWIFAAVTGPIGALTLGVSAINVHDHPLPENPVPMGG